MNNTQLSLVGILIGFIVVCLGFVVNVLGEWCAEASPLFGGYRACTPFDWTIPTIGGIIIIMSLVGWAWATKNKRHITVSGTARSMKGPRSIS